MSGGLLKQEVEIIFAATETLIDTVIAYRKELSARAPDLLLAHPYLRELHAKLDRLADGAVSAVQQRHAASSRGSQFPAATLGAILGVAARRASVLKNKVNNEIQAMALEGTLGMHRRNQSQNVTVGAGGHVGVIVGGDVGAPIHVSITSGQGGLADAVRQLAEGIRSTGGFIHKDEVLESLAYVSEEAAQAPAKRRTGPLKATWDSVKNSVAHLPQLVSLVVKVEEALRGVGLDLTKHI